MSAGTLTVRTNVSRIDGELKISEPKTARSRRVLPLPEPLVPLLKAHQTDQKQDRMKAANVWQENGLVFPAELGTPRDPRSFLRVIETAANKAAIADVGVHTLRHSAATTWLENGTHSAAPRLNEPVQILQPGSISVLEVLSLLTKRRSRRR